MLLGVAATCRGDGPTGPGVPGAVRLAIEPTFAASAEGPVIVLAQARVVVRRLPGLEPHRDVVASFPQDGTPLSLAVDVVTTGARDSFDVAIAALAAAGDTVFRGRTLVEVVRGGRPPVAAPVLAYAGADTAVAFVVVEPRDTMLVVGDTVPLRLRAFRADEGAFEGARVGWRSRDTTLAQVTPDGRLVATRAFQGLWVVAGLATGVADSTRVSARERLAGARTCDEGPGTTHTATIAASETWTAADGPHRITGPLDVLGAGVVLTIEPGALVCVSPRGYLGVYDGARLVAVGTAADSVRFVPAVADSAWGGIELAWEAADSSRLGYALVEHTRNGVLVFGGHRLAMDDSHVFRSEYIGVDISGAGEQRFSGGRVSRSRIERATYVGVQLDAPDVLVEGTRIDSSGYAGILVDTSGARIVDDTITASGYAGIDMYDTPGTLLRGVLIDGSGGPGLLASSAAAGFAAGSAPPRIRNAGQEPQSSGTVISMDFAPYAQLFPTRGSLDSLVGPGAQRLELSQDASITSGQFVVRPELPWLIGGTTFRGTATVTLEPGAQLLLGQSIPASRVIFTDGARLVSRGEPGRPAVITAQDTTRGWGTLEFRGSPQQPSYLTNTVLEWATIAAVQTFDAHAVVIDSSVIRSSRSSAALLRAPAQLRRSLVESSGGDGIIVDSAGAGTVIEENTIRGSGNGVVLYADDVRIVGNVVTGNRLAGVFVGRGSRFGTIARNRFVANGGAGVSRSTNVTVTVAADTNYWGSDAGPLGAGGDGVGGGVTYVPWLLDDMVTLGFPAASASADVAAPVTRAAPRADLPPPRLTRRHRADARQPRDGPTD